MLFAPALVGAFFLTIFFEKNVELIELVLILVMRAQPPWTAFTF